jgi:TrmH family RNA methyltransferase
MIPIHKLARLPASQRRRKLALVFSGLEREALAAGGTASIDAYYATSLAGLALEDPKLPEEARVEIARLRAESAPGDPSTAASVFRLCNVTRHALLAAAGTYPAEWDLIAPGDAARLGSPNGPSPEAASGLERPFYPGVAVYAEDIRSPFNLGSIFRTAEAFGAERVIVSPLCAPPDHPRALRSAMGCVDWLPWDRRSLDDLPSDEPVFALETGGTPIGEFDFPDRGIVIIGSEELGVSPEGLARATYGRVSIPMKGLKASLNVGVAFGILMDAWTAYLRCSASNPD